MPVAKNALFWLSNCLEQLVISSNNVPVGVDVEPSMIGNPYGLKKWPAPSKVKAHSDPKAQELVELLRLAVELLELETRALKLELDTGAGSVAVRVIGGA